jgi:hypothetical protein
MVEKRFRQHITIPYIITITITIIMTEAASKTRMVRSTGKKTSMKMRRRRRRKRRKRKRMKRMKISMVIGE